ncbi:MAG: DNA-binding protein [Nitrospira sp. NTP2]|nr:DNA-binding protein [Nitrospira sp. NTP2]
MEQSCPVPEIEPLVTANWIEANGILSKSTAYKLAQKGIIPSYMVGPSQTGVRFRVSEVLEALRRPAKATIL